MGGMQTLAVVSIVPLLIACGDRSADDAAADTAAATAATAATAAATPQLTDGNIAAWLDNSYQAEMSLAATARTGASSVAVRDFAARMIREHGALKQALDSLVAAKGIALELPTGMEPFQAMIAGRADTLLNTTGRSTDIAYIDGEAKAHGRALEVLNRYVDAASDEDLRALIRRTIAEVRLQQDQAIDILRGL